MSHRVARLRTLLDARGEALLTFLSTAVPQPWNDAAISGLLRFRPRNSRERWKREVRRGRVVRHRR